MIIKYIISAIMLDIVVAIPPGSVTIVSCQRALQFGFRNSVFFIFGSSLSDIFYIALVYYGIARIIADNQLYKIILWIMCGIILIVIGIVSLISAKDIKESRIINFQSHTLATFVSGILITLSNPLTIAGWLGIAGNFFLLWDAKLPNTFAMGIISITLILAGVLAWFIPLNFFVSKLRKIITDKLKTSLIIGSAVCLIIFGIVGIYYAVKSGLFPG